ncbi:hypothetical protein B0H19DRAFT_1033969 [Mycena capillaripes]|nr:hypothetical protein B0H19DRAFT_1033969 [Mycena capillaripes]
MTAFAYFFLTFGLFATEARAACAGADQAQPLYRDWNPTTGDHFYTTDSAEASGASGYNVEGVRALVFATQVAGSVRFLRLYNAAFRNHFYTTNATEAAQIPGYVIQDEDPMYIYPTQLCGSVPFYRLFAGNHFYTVDTGERDAAEMGGWVFESVAGYVFPPPQLEPPSTSGSPTPHKHKPQAGAIAGGIVGSFILIAIGVGLWVFSRRRAHSVSSLAPVSVFDSTAPVPPVMRHGGSKRHLQSPFDVSSPTPAGAETVSSTNLQTSELVGLVDQSNDLLRGQRWNEEEVPPEYTSVR